MSNKRSAVKQEPSYIGEFEELVLLAIRNLGPTRAYGAAVVQALESAGRRTVVGALYTTLSRLEEKGLVSSWMADPTTERGGRAKKYFKVEAKGEQALKKANDQRRKLSSPDFGFAFKG